MSSAMSSTTGPIGFISPFAGSISLSRNNTRSLPMLLAEQDLYLFNEGSHFKLADKLGAHLTTKDGVAGATFAVWAPNAKYVSVVGDFNGWNRGSHPIYPEGQSGIWVGFVPGAHK